MCLAGIIIFNSSDQNKRPPDHHPPVTEAWLMLIICNKSLEPSSWLDRECLKHEIISVKRCQLI